MLATIFFFQMRLGFLLVACLATASALQCNVGNLLVKDGVITGKFLEAKYCGGQCTRSVVETEENTIVVMGCENNEYAMMVNSQDKEVAQTCDAKKLESRCVCEEGDFCNTFEAEEQITDVAPREDAVGPTKCFVGFYAANTTAQTSAGDTVYCGTSSICAWVAGNVGGYQVTAFFCTPNTICTSLLGSTDNCGTVIGDAGLRGCCCSKLDCTSPDFINNTNVVPPTGVTTDKQNVTCYQGAQLNGALINGGNFLPCQGQCSSFSVRTTYGGGKQVLDVFTCDPVELCSALSLNNGCGNIEYSGYNSLIRGCCCSSDNCIDPTRSPPLYPQKQLTCYTGIYIPSTGYSVGAEMICDGQCGRMEVTVGTTLVKYHTCTPYATCYGLGIANGDQCYYSPLEEENLICCCSSSNNCNIATTDIGSIQVNASVLPTTSYPNLCYGGIHLNGIPMVSGSYSRCYGECASATFTTSYYGRMHNTTVYGCDPVTMCKQAGISNTCGPIAGTTASACCCDGDLCIDPLRQALKGLTCYTGIYIKEDNYLVGGEMYCDGWCASLSTTVNSKNSTTYWCAPVKTCQRLGLGMGGDNNCGSIAGTSNTLSGCCCSDSDNCNLPVSLLPNATAIKPRKEPPIVCYEALWINGANTGPDTYRVCNGECVSMAMGDSLPNGTVVTSNLYTCEPSGACASMGIRNTCNSVDGSVITCCCDTDACIDPTVNRIPGNKLGCFVGVVSPYNGGIYAGAEVQCNGMCANLTTTVNNVAFTSFHCMPTKTCRDIAALDNSCGTVNLDRAITGCCCDSSSGCNAQGLNTTFPPMSPPETPLACFSGINVNGILQGNWETCFGDCMSIGINSTLTGTTFVATIYSCDPTTICQQLNTQDRCQRLEPSVEACCCSDSGCLDPTTRPPKKPRFQPLTCWVGVQSSYNSLNAGAEAQCDGTCATLSSTMLGGNNMTIFACVPSKTCRNLGLYNDCQLVAADRVITACCCDDADNCNVIGFNVPANTTAPNYHDYPIVCYQGLRINGIDQAKPQWTACSGDCVSISMNTTFGQTSYTADFFTCDPSTVCRQLGLINNCSTIVPGASGCCCDTDACIDPTIYPQRKPGQPLKCYVGLKTSGGISAGAEVFCDGKCGYMHGLVGGQNVTAYMCAPPNICRSLELNNSPKQLPGDRAITAFCCNNADNCNVFDKSINTSIPIPGIIEYPITCYSGIFVNGAPVTPGGFQSCNGDCAMITMNTTYNGAASSATLYTCDPTRVCKQLGVYNKCSTIEAGIDACCCSSNGCLDPTKNPPKKPGNPLTCYVGVYSPSTGLSAGATMYCNGKCASLRGVVAGNQITTYHCVDSSACLSLELDDACKPFLGDLEINACCCDNFNNCNVNTNVTPIAVPTPSPMIEYPISCFNAIYINGNAVTAETWAVCNGDCASISLNTAMNGQNHSALLYGCDPSSVCTQLKTQNQCNTLQPGVSACCCNTDACIDPKKGRDPSNPLMCYVGVTSTYNNLNVGASVPCSGKCAFLGGLIGGYNVMTYQCVPTPICRSLELYDSCNALPGDRAITACCCDNKPFCNVNDTSITIPPVSPVFEEPIACFSGIYVNNVSVTPTAYTACSGDCVSMSLTTSVNGGNQTATIYTCDPSRVCSALGLTKPGCNLLEPGVSACCCNTDACVTPQKQPGNRLTCYVGVYSAVNNFSAGADVDCTGGMCGSLQITMNNRMVKSYHCVQPSVCQALGVYESCGTVITDREITACCCDTSNNCNVGSEIVQQNIPQTNWTGEPIACWSGTYINGALYGTASWTGCQGDCVSMTYTSEFNGANNTLQIFTCDPIAVCQQMNLKNTCNPNIAGNGAGVMACCCDSDACMSPTKMPGVALTCYVGVYSAANNYSVGADVDCTGGMCASLQTLMNNKLVKSYHCVQPSLCSALGIYRTCQTLTTDRDITGCCCDATNNCNVGSEIVQQNIPQTNWTGAPIGCFSGVYVNGNPFTSPSWVGCNGDCAGITFNTNLNGMNNTLQIFTCDPVTVCQQMGLSNTCNPNIAGNGAGLTACCCDSDGCLTPTKSPAHQLQCYVGVYSAVNNFSAGADVDCTGGMCASVQTMMNNYLVKSYHCLPPSTCSALGVYRSCGTLTTDRDITACCCDSGDNCNIGSEVVHNNIPHANWTGIPIACWSGTYINGMSFGEPNWVGCQGDCASMTYNTRLNGQTNTLQIFTCDPVTLCKQIGLNNQCNPNIAGVGAGVTACCCDSNACISPENPTPVPKNTTATTRTTRSNSVTTPTPTPRHSQYPLTCYVGIYSAINNFSAGAEVDCTGGMCASLQTVVNNNMVKSYHCVETSICYALGIANYCNTITTDRDITGCCCDNTNNCNVGSEIVVNNLQPGNFTGVPIACWTGVWVNGIAASTPNIIGCTGDCAAVQFDSKLNGAPMSLEIYTCDPVSACASMNIINNCNPNIAGVGAGVTACCCSTDACLPPNHNLTDLITTSTKAVATSKTTRSKTFGTTSPTLTPTPTPGQHPTKPLICYVGVYSAVNNFSAGADVDCTGGMCSSLQTLVNNKLVKSYHCIQESVCSALGVDRTCGTLTADSAITACCCDNKNNCNVGKEVVNHGFPQANFTGAPITCWSGTWINDVPYGVPSIVVCQGDCFSVQYDTTLNGGTNTIQIFTCDPLTVCQQMNLQNACNPNIAGVGAGVTACCCGSDVCTTHEHIIPIPVSTSTMKATKGSTQSPTTKGSNPASIASNIIFATVVYLLVSVRQ